MEDYRNFNANRPRRRKSGKPRVEKDKLKECSDVLSREVVLFCRRAKEQKIEGVILNQLLKAGTSVQANIREAHGAQGNRDFAAKFHVALRECNECDGWFLLLLDTKSISLEEFKFFHNKCVEIIKLLDKSIDTALRNMDEAERATLDFAKEWERRWKRRSENWGSDGSKGLTGNK